MDKSFVHNYFEMTRRDYIITRLFISNFISNFLSKIIYIIHIFYALATNDWSGISETCIYFSIVEELFELHSVVEPLTFSTTSYHR